MRLTGIMNPEKGPTETEKAAALAQNGEQALFLVEVYYNTASGGHWAEMDRKKTVAAAKRARERFARLGYEARVQLAWEHIE